MTLGQEIKERTNSRTFCWRRSNNDSLAQTCVGVFFIRSDNFCTAFHSETVADRLKKRRGP
jgi:hypothetical protein